MYNNVIILLYWDKIVDIINIKKGEPIMFNNNEGPICRPDGIYVYQTGGAPKTPPSIEDYRDNVQYIYTIQELAQYIKVEFERLDKKIKELESKEDSNKEDIVDQIKSSEMSVKSYTSCRYCG
jgi:hypothetical protein